jgi:hypothetical protein
MRIFNTKALSEEAMTGTSVVQSDAIWLGHIAQWSVQLDWTRTSGSLTGVWKVQASNAPVDYNLEGIQPAAGAIWTDLSGATGNVTNAASGNALYNAADSGYQWIRVVYTNTTGVGVLNARVNGKGV